MPASPATCAVLFVDISGSTRLYETLGDERALARVGGTLEILARVCADCGGRVIKTAGDGAMCSFATADAELRAACLMQEKTAPEAGPEVKGYGIHIGCHFGPVLESAGDLFGDTVMSDVPSSTILSDRISKDLKKRGFSFVETTIIYAFMQAVGMTNDHTKNCFRY